MKFRQKPYFETKTCKFWQKVAIWSCPDLKGPDLVTVSYTHLRAHETDSYLVCRLLLEKKKYFRCFEVSTCPLGQVRTCPNHNFSGPDMSKSRFFRSGHDQIRSFQVWTWPNRDFLSKFACFGFKIRFLRKFHNDSASFCPEELKKHVILIKNLNIWPKIPKIPQKIKKIGKNRVS